MSMLETLALLGELNLANDDRSFDDDSLALGLSIVAQYCVEVVGGRGECWRIR